MDPITRIEQALADAVATTEGLGSPPKLAAALRYSVFPGGQRIRPRLCMAVARACGAGNSSLPVAAAAAIELLHCASLVHDDLPCFDDAETRRGKPSVHRAYGECLAVLAGDALIVLAFQTLVRGGTTMTARLPLLFQIVGGAAGMPFGIAAGQAWECEPKVELSRYQQQKTGSMFAAATAAGAAASGADPDAWRMLGELLGEAYQVADDIRDVAADPQDLGKPVGRDLALDRPSAARELGLAGAIGRLDGLVADALHSIPPCPGALELRANIMKEAKCFLPKELAQHAA
jgi:geranylgeranyl diphosphate synthase type II